ncbi:MAG: hypothetical protein NC122_06790 [Faecalibacterium sp.]|nr:hypothetical protein [Ruminococcus sp.]MCM1392398.1 hypothetical protein [Ruminococcus sp.]MCM1485896.1 hypothetical protein [Faecalibacterium sp.]
MMNAAVIPYRKFSDFTQRLAYTKYELDDMFKIGLRADAEKIIREMKEYNQGRKAFGSLQIRLLIMLNQIPEYAESDKEIEYKGRTVKLPLGNFSDMELNSKVIAEYERYVRMLPTDSELDELFLDKLNKVYSDYHSSSDYMSRLVRRLLRAYNLTGGDEYKYDTENETTRVLILKHLIRQFGYCEGISEWNGTDLKLLVLTKFGGDYKKINDRIFDVLNKTKKSSKVGKNQFVSDESVDSLTKLQGAIIYKGTVTPVNEEICKALCELVDPSVLSEEALNGTAKVLSDCFRFDYTQFGMVHMKGFSPAKIKKSHALYKALGKASRAGKSKAEFGISDFPYLIRAAVLLTDVADKIPVNETTKILVQRAFPTVEFNFDGAENMAQCIDGNAKKNIFDRTKISDSPIDEKRNAVDFVDEAEKYVSKDANTYLQLLYDRLGKRVNDYTKINTGDGYKKNKGLLTGDNNDYELLRMVDELASAKFSAQGKTREYLYVFAIAFDMTFKRDKKTDPKMTRDIQKNLFFDYYADNIVNSLSEDMEKGMKSVPVDGHGINYKNFAEVAFLWSLDQDMTAYDKLKTAYEIIRYCKENGKSSEDFAMTEKGAQQNRAMSDSFERDYMEASFNDVDTIKAYLINSMPCKINGSIMKINGENRTAKQVIEHETQRLNKWLGILEEQMYFGDTFDSIVESLEEDSTLVDFIKLYAYMTTVKCSKCGRCKNDRGEPFPYCESFFTSEPWIDENGKEHEIKCNSWNKDYDAYKEGKRNAGKNQQIDRKTPIERMFDKLIGGKVDRFLDEKMYFEQSFSKVLFHCNNNQAALKKIIEKIENRLKLYFDNGFSFDKPSRTAIVVLCFYQMLAVNCYKVTSDLDAVRNFEEFYRDFCEGKDYSVDFEDTESGEEDKEKKEEDKPFKYAGANALLEKAGYQKINSKNLFDIYLIFIAYRDNFRNESRSQSDRLVAYYEKLRDDYESAR